MTDTIESLRADAADLRAKIAEAERQRDDARAEAREHNESHVTVADLLTVAQSRAERAEAACAEMRAALVALESCVVWSDSTQSFGLYQRVKDVLGPARALLARTDLGRGMVVVPGPIDALVDRLVLAVCDCHDGSDLWAHTRRDPETFRRAVRGALLDGGKVKP